MSSSLRWSGCDPNIPYGPLVEDIVDNYSYMLVCGLAGGENGERQHCSKVTFAPQATLSLCTSLLNAAYSARPTPTKLEVGIMAVKP